MGAALRTRRLSDDEASEDNDLTLTKIIAMQNEFSKTLEKSLAVQVAHFTPSNFPLTPQINRNVSDLCESSWMVVSAMTATGESGLVLFYNDFYNRLEQLDTNGRFEAALTQNIGSDDDKIAAKGAIIIRIVHFMLAMKRNSRRVQMSLAMLGKSHAQRQIRPWQYSLFLEVLLHTLSRRLGKEATHETMRAWVNLAAFVLQGMLPNAIRGQVVETEVAVNTSCEFYGGEIENELEALAESRASREPSFSNPRVFSGINTPSRSGVHSGTSSPGPKQKRASGAAITKTIAFGH